MSAGDQLMKNNEEEILRRQLIGDIERNQHNLQEMERAITILEDDLKLICETDTFKEFAYLSREDVKVALSIDPQTTGFAVVSTR